MEAIIGAGVGAFLLMLAIIGFLVYVRGEKEVKVLEQIGEFEEDMVLGRPGNGGEMFGRRASNASGYETNENGNLYQGGEITYGTNENGNLIYGIAPVGIFGNEDSFGGSPQPYIHPRTGRLVIPSNSTIFFRHNSSQRKQRRRRSRKSKRV